ncbi:hypothetical protein CRG98_025663 [Punica granatum]|uniref:Ubiquitin-like protease family profile domain-containing protein n=1 Tax=Punica granatum TaxID=22663 RepID=A0A2I0JCI9_PUNGR|nr:hypothetical protein CRG98_025663 [Punica granatum]
MGEVERGDKEEQPLRLDWSALLPDSDDPPPELIVSGRGDQGQGGCSAPVDPDQCAFAEIQGLSDQKLEESIASKTKTLQTIGCKLHDGGSKLRGMLERLLEEKERRKLRRNGEDVDECVRITTATSGPSDGFREDTTPSEKQSSFSRLFTQSLDENNACRIGDVDKAPLSFNHGDWRRKKCKRKLSPVGRRKPSLSSRKRPFQSPREISLDRKQHSLDGGRRGRARFSSNNFYGELFSHRLAKRKNDMRALPFNDSTPRKELTVVLDDEEECHLIETAEQAGEIAECMEETKIYYPSRDDPGSVEICSADLDCLKPEGYLTSTIMNFYILYLQLQASQSSRGINDYLFFNTYFYKKLQEAVSCKENVRDASFARLRRWWKGVNIFQKAYVLIPIHDELHWSLAIICVPDKEDRSGPILLHLDSLQLHRSKSIFDNIRRFLVEEWNHLKQEVTPSDLLIADEVWERLPRQISDKKIMHSQVSEDEKTLDVIPGLLFWYRRAIFSHARYEGFLLYGKGITLVFCQLRKVPQQKNDYDCGLFVLYFMERFIEEAPERLKKNDLAMFGKQWFKPEEASSLRVKIRKLLLEELEKAKGCPDTPESSPRSGSSPSGLHGDDRRLTPKSSPHSGSNSSGYLEMIED